MLELLNTNYQFFGPFGQFGVVVVLIWTLIWKGLALWHAARRGEKWWFIAFLLVQTIGILELVYLIFVAKALPISTKKKKK